MQGLSNQAWWEERGRGKASGREDWFGEDRHEDIILQILLQDVFVILDGFVLSFGGM